MGRSSRHQCSKANTISNQAHADLSFWSRRKAGVSMMNRWWVICQSIQTKHVLAFHRKVMVSTVDEKRVIYWLPILIGGSFAPLLAHIGWISGMLPLLALSTLCEWLECFCRPIPSYEPGKQGLHEMHIFLGHGQNVNSHTWMNNTKLQGRSSLLWHSYNVN